MPPQSPHDVRFTDHAVKAAMLGYTRADVAAAVLDRHDERRRNHGAVQWRIEVDRLVVVYDRPDHGDVAVARIVTLWRRPFGHEDRRPLRPAGGHRVLRRVQELPAHRKAPPERGLPVAGR